MIFVKLTVNRLLKIVILTVMKALTPAPLSMECTSQG